MSKRGSYLGGSTIVRDSDYQRRLAHRRKMTEKHERKMARVRDQRAAQWQAYEEGPKSILIKRGEE